MDGRRGEGAVHRTRFIGRFIPRYALYATAIQQVRISYGPRPSTHMPVRIDCSRVAASLAHAIECEEMVVPDMETTYVSKAIKWGNQRSELLGLRRKLWGKRLTTPLFDTRLWVREWEECLVAAWVHYCEGKPPDHIDMAAIEDEEGVNGG